LIKKEYEKGNRMCNREERPDSPLRNPQPGRTALRDLCKVGTGIMDKDTKEIDSLFSGHIVPDIPKNILIKSRMLPDIFIEPAVVIEGLGMKLLKARDILQERAREAKDLHCGFLVFCVSDMTKYPTKQLQLKRQGI
jgi:hypothetical protein